MKIPVLRPQLPTAERLLPYLRRIDEARIYSNWGPLVTELERRLVQVFGLASGTVATASSGTAALMAAILAAAGRATAERPFAIAPAFTFVATAASIEQCGYRVFLADVDADSWMLDPEAIAARIDPNILSRTAVIVPVAPFGRPVPQTAWRAFQERTGIPVVIDGAACFEPAAQPGSKVIGDVPVVMSLHATKSFSTAEGGCVASTDSALVARAGRALNFGFHGTRESQSPSTNGKMSEYHAAVGLAELDGWQDKQAMLGRVCSTYTEAFRGHGLRERFFSAPAISSSYALFACISGAEARSVQESLERNGVDLRLWYGTGLHRQRYFADLPRETLSITDDLAPRLLGLPMSVDLTAEQIARVASAVAEGSRRS